MLFDIIDQIRRDRNPPAGEVQEEGSADSHESKFVAADLIHKLRTNFPSNKHQYVLTDLLANAGLSVYNTRTVHAWDSSRKKSKASLALIAKSHGISKRQVLYVIQDFRGFINSQGG